MTGAQFAQALVLGSIGQPNGTRKQQHQQAIQAGMRVSRQGFDQRFSAQAVTFMRELLAVGMTQLVQSERENVLLPQFNGVYLTDCSRMVWGKTGVKLGLRLDIQRGQAQVCLMPITTHDQKAAVIDEALPAGALHVADLGFFKLARFQRWTETGVYWLTRHKAGVQLYHLNGERLHLAELFQRTSAVTLPVLVGSGKQRLQAFLQAAPLTPEALTKRMTRLNEQARLDQRPLSSTQRQLAPWTLYLTNLPDLTFAQAHLLYRTRWQIELVFKLWKSHARILHSRSADPVRQVCEGFAKLLGVLITHWSLLVAGWQLHTSSPLDAIRLVRTYLPLLQRAFVEFDLFMTFYTWLSHDLALAPPLSKRKKSPSAFQLWASFP